MRPADLHLRGPVPEKTEQLPCPAPGRGKDPRFALPLLLVLLAMAWQPAAVQAGIATPTSISICDDPHFRGTAMYNKYCGGIQQSYLPQGPSPEELHRRQEQQRQELQRQREEERKRNAEAADRKGLEAERRGDWREAANRFIEALRFAPESLEIKAHLERAKTALADVSTAAEILVLHQRVEDAIAAANLDAFREGVEDDLTAQRLALMSESFRGQTATTPVREPVTVQVSAGTRKRLYPALGRPVAPGTPPAIVLERAQPKIRELDKEIRRAQLVLRHLIESNAQSEEQRVEWVKVSEEATVEAQDLSVSLVIDLVDAHVDHLAKVRKEEGLEVLNRLLNRTPESGQKNGLHAAFGMLLNRKEELERIKSETRLAAKSNDLRQKIAKFDLNRDTKYTWENLWDVVNQFKKVEELAGPSKDLLDAAYTIYKQAASFENLSAIRANQEKTLQAAATLHKYIVRLEEQKRALRH
jgi:hypothetical protein